MCPSADNSCRPYFNGCTLNGAQQTCLWDTQYSTGNLRIVALGLNGYVYQHNMLTARMDPRYHKQQLRLAQATISELLGRPKSWVQGSDHLTVCVFVCVCVCLQVVS